jgi:hypothetical protein
MPDYQKMYIRLFNKVTDVIAELQQIQRDTEQFYIKNADTELFLLKAKDNTSSNIDKASHQIWTTKS